MYLAHYDADDCRLADLLPAMDLLENLDPGKLSMAFQMETHPVFMPDETYAFLHEAAVIEYHGVLFAAWYNCPINELRGLTPIRGTKSTDGGKTWGPVETLAQDPSGKLLYCPPVYGIADDRLYLMMNSMVGPDLIHSLDLYEYDERSGQFRFCWSRPLPFKLNTNVYHLPNGKLLLPGRIAPMDGFPTTPAVLISDSGKMDGKWRLVRIAENGDLPDGSALVHPEISAIIEGEDLYIFCRDDQRQVPLLYHSPDLGETWEGPIAHNIPLINSKIYSGTLQDGRHYLIGNLPTESKGDRSRLALFFTRPHSLKFSSGLLLQDGKNQAMGFGHHWHYPVAWETGNHLMIIYTVSMEDHRRGAVLTAVPLK